MAENQPQNGGKSSTMAENQSQNGGKPSPMAENIPGTEKIPIPLSSFKNVYNAIRTNPKMKYTQLEDTLGLGETTIRRAIAWLKENGYINPDKPKINGVWQLL